ncbi:integrase catalytic domain-containing protein [Trichonephila inaurata madagascariensis]|uniref:Integrase catalytic domain-containing protein n=1 Tax=Trichonephila inaurata madagascariensis TaxID=2747483 RepID=A0A8X7BZU7_9ARAC|nr:integrase catalytic domain-containing protein [Trichonephila inaurata madagascariensis]
MKLKSSLYIDNCVTSVNFVAELNTFEEKSLKKILKKAKFDLLGWKNNFLPEIEKTVSDILGITKEKRVSVFGLAWDKKKDTLSCEHIKTDKDNGQMTKRKILFIVHKIFDPIGFTCPVKLLPKLLLQECWKHKISWDKELPYNIVHRFDKWLKYLDSLKDIEIPRRLI